MLQKVPYSPLDGIIGMAPYEDSLFRNLVNNGNHKNIFALHIGGPENESHLTLGGFDPSFSSQKTDMIPYISISNNAAWTIDASGLLWN